MNGPLLFFFFKALTYNHTSHTHQHDSSGGSGNDGFGKWADVGLPGGDTTYVFKENYAACYDARTRNPKWVMERVTRATSMGNADRRVMEFYEEAAIVDARFRAQNADYLMS